jgi:hypothetical protein
MSFGGATSHGPEGASSASLAWAEIVLRDQGMPPDELSVVLTTPDRELVRRHLELHLERLEERLVEHRRNVAAVQWILGSALLAETSATV